MAKLEDLIQQKQQRDEDWKAKKTAEREELSQLSDGSQTLRRPVLPHRQ